MPCRWKGAHRLKAWSGVAAGLLGWVALGLAFLAPLGYYTSSSTVCADSCLTTREAGPENLAALAMPAVAWGVFLELLSFCLLGVVVSAVLHAQTGARGWYRLLWGSTLLLVGLIAWMCIGFPAYSVGLLLAPAGGSPSWSSGPLGVPSLSRQRCQHCRSCRGSTSQSARAWPAAWNCSAGWRQASLAWRIWASSSLPR